jgi:hypothetical protein
MKDERNLFSLSLGAQAKNGSLIRETWLIFVVGKKRCSFAQDVL